MGPEVGSGGSGDKRETVVLWIYLSKRAQCWQMYWVDCRAAQVSALVGWQVSSWILNILSCVCLCMSQCVCLRERKRRRKLGRWVCVLVGSVQLCGVCVCFASPI